MRFELVNTIDKFPIFYFALARLMRSEKNEFIIGDPLNRKLVSNSTEFVVEGFPRCANTYASAAFQISADGGLNLAHHFHASSQVVMGVEKGLPVVVLIRNPIEAIASLCIRQKDISPVSAAKKYIGFYSRMEKVRKNVVIAHFPDVTGDFSSVLKNVNTKFGTSLKTDFGSKEKQLAFSLIEKRNIQLNGGVINYERIALPNDVKKKSSGERGDFIQDELNGYVDDLLSIYRELIKDAG